MPKVFIDTNVIIDFLIDREPFRLKQQKFSNTRKERN